MQIIVATPKLAPPRPTDRARARSEFLGAAIRYDAALEALEIAARCGGMRDRVAEPRKSVQDLYRELAGHDML